MITKAMKILIVGGTFNTEKNSDNTYGKASGLINKLAAAINVYNTANSKFETIDIYNGGNYADLDNILNSTPNYDIVFWFANVDNELPKIRDVKTIAPLTLLITSKRNDNNKYTFQELIQRALASKSNLVFEFSKQPLDMPARETLNSVYGANPDPELAKKIQNTIQNTIQNPVFNIMIFDPLGNQWYNGTDIEQAVNAAIERLIYLKNITRQGTIRTHEDRNEIFKLYFDNTIREENTNLDILESTSDEIMFIDLVRTYAERFHELINPACDVKRFLGNCSIRPNVPSEFRCLKGMPSFKHGDYVFVSQRNVDKMFLDINHFVPTRLENGKIYYCGDKKPSVDTPIQLRLYETLPNIKYMLHAHCYVDNAEFTNTPIPCGAIEEVDEVLAYIDKHYKSRELTRYRINLRGHGSIVMGNTIDDMTGIEYIARPIPERM